MVIDYGTLLQDMLVPRHLGGRHCCVYLPWVVTGDFNGYSIMSEKRGGYVPPRGPGHSIFKLHERCMKSLNLWRPIHGEINFDSSLMDALSNMARQAQILNRDVFGNIFGSKRRILARVQGIQK
ncbi:hypothetical protein H0E87_005556 [Populus deltoides]|uniref:Uncharacterized protein n=1 Tax=Populus deltoides TaxID=3696 RepID=A0A8T2ZJW7_POPDE|nr:hypothetical protein H0E87_005556 [Populus deltoides]